MTCHLVVIDFIYFLSALHNSKDPVGLRQTNCAIPDYKYWKLACPKLFQSAQIIQSCSVNACLAIFDIDFRLDLHNSRDLVGLSLANCQIDHHEFWKLACPKLL